MSRPLLLDAVTLRHFAAADALDVLEAVARTFSMPRWSEAVQDEIVKGREAGEITCTAILAESLNGGWLGVPERPTHSDLKEISRLQIKLSPPPDERSNAGEAESIALAKKLSGAFATDDNDAYDFDTRRLGEENVFDTVDLLRLAVGANAATPSESLRIANAIRANGRHLRRDHPSDLFEDYFLP